jgi:hypothetical protein
VKTICNKVSGTKKFSKMKKFLNLKLSALLLLVSMGMLTNPYNVTGQAIVSNAYEGNEIPLKPEKLQALPLYHSLVQLRWSDRSSNESGFKIYIKDKYRNQYRLLFSVPKNKTTAYIWDLEEHTEYSFYIAAYNQYGNSESSNIANTTTPHSYPLGTPEAPSNLAIINNTVSDVEIEWEDNANNELGFKIARKISGEPFFEIIDSVETDILTYREVGLEPDHIYLYKVCAYNEYGFSGYTNTVSVNTSGQHEDRAILHPADGNYILKGNYPNPFNPTTLIEFSLLRASTIKLTVYNSLGEEVNVISNSFLQAGNYLYEWNGSELSSGIYFYKLEADDFTEVRKMVLIK